MLAHPIITTDFANAKNSSQHKKAVLDWLEADFVQQGSPRNHFWHNRKTIASAFENHCALVALNENKEVVGYMIWSMDSEASAEIDIVEVKKAYQGQGISKKMLSDFTAYFSSLCVLTGYVLPQAQKIFSHMGWGSKNEIVLGEEKEYFYKILKPSLKSEDALVSGCVLAVCLVDYCQFTNNRQDYADKLLYFPIELDASLKLHQPIIVEKFNYEYYLSIYYDKKFILEGKSKHLFDDANCQYGAELLVINKITPKAPVQKILEESGFLKAATEKITAIETEKIDYKNILSSTKAATFFVPEQSKQENLVEVTKKRKLESEDNALVKRRRVSNEDEQGALQHHLTKSVP